MKPSELRLIAAIGLVALIAFALRAWSLDAQSLWRDEVDALRFATAPWEEKLSNFTRHGWNGPLYYVLLGAWIRLAGSSEYAMRFFSLAFGVLAVPLTYALGRRLFDAETGMLAALLVMASPYLTWYSQEAKMYALVLALALLAIYGLRRALDGAGRRWWAVQVIATSLAFYCHILAALLIPVQVLLGLIWWPRTRQEWRGALASLASLTLPYVPLAAWQAPLAFEARETGFGHYSLGEMAQILLTGWSSGMLGWGEVYSAVLMVALAIWGLVSSFRSRRSASSSGHRLNLALACWLLIPLLAVWLISLRQPLFTDRYLIWAAPAFYLLIALGLATLWRWGGGGRAVVVVLVAAVLILSGVNQWRQVATPIKSDFRAAAAYVARYRKTGLAARPSPLAGDDRRELAHSTYVPLVVSGRGGPNPILDNALFIFQIPYGRYTFDYYFPADEYRWAEGLYTNHRAADGSYLIGETTADWHMEEMTAGYEAVWFIVTEMEMWDRRGLVQAWLDTHARRVAEAHFTRVDVYRYVR